MIDIEVRPHERAEVNKASLALPVLDPTAELNPRRLWKAQQRDLYILGPDQKLHYIVNLDKFDPSPGIRSDVGEHYEFLRGLILSTME